LEGGVVEHVFVVEGWGDGDVSSWTGGGFGEGLAEVEGVVWAWFAVIAGGRVGLRDLAVFRVRVTFRVEFVGWHGGVNVRTCLLKVRFFGC
jgi:hypothetical protein